MIVSLSIVEIYLFITALSFLNLSIQGIKQQFVHCQIKNNNFRNKLFIINNKCLRGKMNKI